MADETTGEVMGPKELVALIDAQEARDAELRGAVVAVVAACLREPMGSLPPAVHTGCVELMKRLRKLK